MRWMIAVMTVCVGCTDLAQPSELARDQILAVRSTPAASSRGERGRLDVLLAGPDGRIEEADLEWSVAVSTAAHIETDGDGAWIVVADDARGAVDVSVHVATASAEFDA